jgi:hypothetical protein
MDTRQQRLTAEIELTKRNLAAELRELKSELSTLQRQLAMAAGVVAAVLIVLKLIGVVRRHRSES